MGSISIALLVFCLSMLLGAGCSVPSPQSQSVPPNGSTPASAVAEINNLLASGATQASPSLSDYRIGPEDVLQITVFNISGVDGGVTPRDLTVRVSQQGIVTLPLLGEIEVAGLTTLGLEELLRERYGKFIYDPEVGVLIKEFRSVRVSVIGAVNRAGVFDLTGPKTLIDVLAMAGGVSERAGNQVHIYRQGPDGRESHVIDLFSLASNVGLINDRTAELVTLPVQAGDVINVPQAGRFFVDGAVRRPGSFPLGRRYTVTQALALAGGVNKDLADYSAITIFRFHGTSGVEQLPINLNAIRSGTDPDLPVQADDVLFVPISGAKWAWDFFLRYIRIPSLIPSPLP